VGEDDEELLPEPDPVGVLEPLGEPDALAEPVGLALDDGDDDDEGVLLAVALAEEELMPEGVEEDEE
jgi:hypothetical protein